MLFSFVLSESDEIFDTMQELRAWHLMCLLAILSVYPFWSQRQLTRPLAPWNRNSLHLQGGREPANTGGYREERKRKEGKRI